MTKLNWSDVNSMCHRHNDINNIKSQFSDKNKLYFAVVLSNENFTREYSESERTYIFTSDNKAFISGMCGYSIFGHCKFDDDYMRIEHLKYEYFYQCNKEGEPL